MGRPMAAPFGGELPEGRMKIRFRREVWRLRFPFRITGRIYDEAEIGVVELEDDAGRVGRGEAMGAHYKGDDIAAIERGVAEAAGAIRAGAGRVELQALLPDCGARNAIDCAFWDLEAKQAGRPVWALSGLSPPRPLLTTYTLGADPPAVMARRALGFPEARALKLKLVGEPEDLERVRQVRAARPDAWLAVDANRGYAPERIADLLPVLVEADVRLIEQPFALGAEARMSEVDWPVPTAADESVQTIDDLPKLAGRFDMINIKLDKCGGLTHALAMAAAAKDLGLGLMVGNMTSTSLGMAPAFVVGQHCEVVDLDGPILLAEDRTPGVTYVDGRIWSPDDVWGGPR